MPAHLSSRGVTQKLGQELDVFGGAARVYPIRRDEAPYEAPVFPTQFRAPTEVFPQLVQTTRDAVARHTRHDEQRSDSGALAVGGATALPRADGAGVMQVDTPSWLG